MKKFRIVSILLIALLSLALVGCNNDKEYKITFIADGATISEVKLSGKGIVEIPQAPQREGYRFVGWFSADGEFTSVRFEMNNITADVIVNAVYERIEYYNVTFDYLEKTCKVEKGQTIAEPEKPIKRGHTFVEWQFNNVKYDFSLPVNADLYLKAKFIPNEYTIILDPNGGTIGQDSITAVFGKYVEFPTPQNDGEGIYFAGWYDGDKLYESGIWDEDKNITLKATWSLLRYEITFETNGGEIENESKYYYGIGEFKPYIPQRGLYYFEGWFYDANFDEAFNKDREINSDFILYAKWKEPITIKLLFNNGQQEGRIQVKYNSTAVISEPVYEGYEFNGWVYSGTGVAYKSDDIFTSDTTLLASWLKLYNVMINPDNGQDVIELEVAEGKTVTQPQTPVKNGYRFDGWYSDSGTKFDFTTPISADIEIIAKWIDSAEEEFINEYIKIKGGIAKVSIVTHSGEEISSKDEYVLANLSVTSAENPEYNKTQLLTEIRGRGNSSWYWWDKKSYRVKLDKKTDLLGLTNSKHYALISNMNDRSFMRNYLAYSLGRSSGNIEWQPQSRYVELTLNGNYVGLYQLVEIIRVENDNSKIDISGTAESVYDTGFLVEQIPDNRKEDAVAAGSTDVFVRAGEFWWEVKYPERGLNQTDAEWNATLNYLTEYIDNSLNAIYTQDRAGFLNYCEESTFIDYWLTQELFSNYDCMQASVYMTKAQGGKLKMSSLWDFDVGADNIVYRKMNYDEFYAMSAKIFNELMKEPTFASNAANRAIYLTEHDWQYMVNGIETLYAQLEDAAARNYGIWKISDPNGADKDKIPVHITNLKTYREQVNYLKNWLQNRIEWLKEEFPKFL